MTNYDSQKELTAEFYKKLVSISNELSMSPEILLNVMMLESGLNPKAGNPHGGATGLIQFMPSTLKMLGFSGSQEDFASTSAIDQLDYVKAYVKAQMPINGGPFTSVVQYYVANFLPACLSKPGIKNNDMSTILVENHAKEPHIPGSTIEYEQIVWDVNKGLDADHDGKITLGDLNNMLTGVASRSNYKAILAEMSKATGYSPKEKSQDKTVSTNQDALNKILDIFAEQKNILIKISGQDLCDKIENARILCEKLFILDKNAYTYTDNENVEVICKTSSLNLLKKISDPYIIYINKKTSLDPINIKIAQSNYRKFILRNINGKS